MTTISRCSRYGKSRRVCSKRLHLGHWHRPTELGAAWIERRGDAHRRDWRHRCHASESRYIDEVNPVVLASARKHGVGDEDMIHAYNHPIRVFEFDDLTMLVGADSAGRLLEVGVASAEGIDFIVHAMPTREKFLR